MRQHPRLTLDYHAPTPSEQVSPTTSLKITCFLGLGVVMATLVLFHVPGINGPWYWKWAWRRLPVWPYYPLMIVAAAPVLAGLVLHSFGARAILILSLMMIGVFAMKLSAAAVLDRPMSLNP